MTTREKIIVGIMCLAIIYGAFDLTVSRKSRRTTPTPVGNTIHELKSFVSEIDQKLNSQQLAKEYPYVINQVVASWEKDPFIQSAKPLQKRLNSDPKEQRSKLRTERASFNYSGYIQLGTTRMAIINGMEYAEGESLADKTYYVKSISPQSVIIGKVQGSDTIQLPISEFDSGSVE
jgi:hypothetical protein